MDEIFVYLINVSISASFILLAILIARPFLTSAPKYIKVVLWGLVGLRLLFPLNLESALSLIPAKETIPTDIMYERYPAIDSGIPVLNEIVNPMIGTSLEATPEYSVNPLQIVTLFAEWIWIGGMILMLSYLVISYIHLKLTMRESLRRECGVYLSDRADTPFILGVICPRIYVPSDIREEDYYHVLSHERAHLSRLDHIWKPLAFVLLSVYWFNPLMWMGYILLCRDIELACDERVIKGVSEEERAKYSEALLRCSMKRHGISACPLAFGEVGVKSRIRSVLDYKKPTVLVIAVSILLCALFAVCFLTYPEAKGSDIDAGIYYASGTMYRDSSFEAIPEESVPLFVFTESGEVMVESSDASFGTYVTLGKKNGIYLSAGDYDALFSADGVSRRELTESIREENARVWKIIPSAKGCTVTSDEVYIFLQERGQVYLGYAYTRADGSSYIGQLYLMHMNEILPTYLYTAYYVSQGGEQSSTIVLNSENNTMSLSFAGYDNYTARGSYTVEENRLVFMTDDSFGFVFVFLIDGESLILDEVRNMDGYVELVKGGEVFVRTYNTFSPVFDTVFFDIDSDGAVESLSVQLGNDGEKIILRFSVYHWGEKSDYAPIDFEAYDRIYFDKSTANNLLLICEKNDLELTTDRYAVRYKDGEITLDRLDK